MILDNWDPCRPDHRQAFHIADGSNFGQFNAVVFTPN